MIYVYGKTNSCQFSMTNVTNNFKKRPTKTAKQTKDNIEAEKT